ncbi:MAG TPA: hypothetical protein VL380_00040 [Nitrosospira sp.]|nr:hypothetical protein [Nitrosospira sp.]
MKNIIPGNLDFSALNLSSDSSTDGGIEFDWSLIEDICEASGIDISEFRDTDEGNVSILIHQWYAEHRARGGEPDPIMEDIIIEAKLEELFGSESHKAGKA